LKRGDDVIGGLGVAGSGAETDHEIAKAAASQFFDEVPAWASGSAPAPSNTA
jgi:hypothetical protein